MKSIKGKRKAHRVDKQPVPAAVLVEARGRAESRRACADDEDADLLKKIEENLKRGKKSASREVEEVENLRDRLDGAKSDLCSLFLFPSLCIYLALAI